MRNVLLSAALASCLFWQSGCEKVENSDRAIIGNGLMVTLADKETGEIIIGPSRTYPPDSIRVYNQEWEEIENTVVPCVAFKPEAEHVILIKDMYKRGPATALEFDTTYYLKFPAGDIDTIKVRYTYDEQKDFYYQLIQYNDSLYDKGSPTTTCGIYIYKKP